MLEDTTDKTPIYLGKPSAEVVDVCIKASGFSPEETLVVGDRLYTDIACGINANVDTCVLFTGEAKPEHIVSTPYKPTYSFDTVSDLLDALTCPF
jgi:ribonucleotide monophosphatase NagD (HAD superfamily)